MWLAVEEQAAAGTLKQTCRSAKVTGTRSDIDVRIDGQLEIDTRGVLSDTLYHTLPGVSVGSRLPGGSRPPDCNHSEEIAVMEAAAPEVEYLSTVGDLNPYGCLNLSAWMLSSWEQSRSGRTDDDRLSRRKREMISLVLGRDASGLAGSCRLPSSWNTIFFAVPAADIAQVVKHFSDLLQSHCEPCITSFCVLLKSPESRGTSWTFWMC